MWEKKVYRRSPRVFDDAIVPKTSILSVAILSKGLKDRKENFSAFAQYPKSKLLPQAKQPLTHILSVGLSAHCDT